MPWPSQPTPYASTFKVSPAFPMYMTSYTPRPPHSCLLCKLSLKSSLGSAKTEARDLEVHLMSQTNNLNAVRDARIRSATSVRGRKHTDGKEQAPGM